MKYNTSDKPEASPTLPNPGRTLAIGDCFDCPFGVSEEGDFSDFSCELPIYFDGEPRAIPWMVDVPCVPPEWCPLRRGPVTLEIRETP